MENTFIYLRYLNDINFDCFTSAGSFTNFSNYNNSWPAVKDQPQFLNVTPQNNKSEISTHYTKRHNSINHFPSPATPITALKSLHEKVGDLEKKVSNMEKKN